MNEPSEEKMKAVIDDTSVQGMPDHKHTKHRVSVSGLTYKQAKALARLVDKSIVAGEISAKKPVSKPKYRSRTYFSSIIEVRKVRCANERLALELNQHLSFYNRAFHNVCVSHIEYMPDTHFTTVFIHVSRIISKS